MKVRSRSVPLFRTRAAAACGVCSGRRAHHPQPLGSLLVRMVSSGSDGGAGAGSGTANDGSSVDVKSDKGNTREMDEANNNSNIASTCSTTSQSSAPSSASSLSSASISSASSSSSSSLFDRLTDLYSQQTGQSELSALKSAVLAASSQFDAALAQLHRCRAAVQSATAVHDAVHQRHSTLLLRRDAWTAADATHFAQLTTEEVTARQSLSQARTDLAEAEATASHRQVAYMDAMRRRYHEEQTWNDRWRVLSTYGTWGLIGLNAALFVGGQWLHYRRETGRLRRIEELILRQQQQSDQQSNQQQSGDIGGDDNGDQAVAPAAVVIEANTISTNGGAIDDIIENDTNEDSDQPPDADDSLVYNDVLCPSDSESDAMVHEIQQRSWTKRWRSKIRTAWQHWELSSQSSKREESDFDESSSSSKASMKDQARAYHDRAGAVVARFCGSVHWPSAALGGAASAVGLLLILGSSGNRK